MNKNIQEFVNHSDFTTDMFITKRKDDNRWVVSSKSGKMRFYIKIHTKEMRIRNDKTKACYNISFDDIIPYLNKPFFNILSLALKRRIYRGYNDYVYNNDISRHFKSNNIVVYQYNECNGELHGDVVKYHDIAFASPDKEGAYQIVVPEDVFNEMLTRQWECLSELQQYIVGCHLSYNDGSRYNLFVETMLSHPVLLKLKELYTDETLTQSVYGTDNFVQLKFRNNTNMSDVIFGIPPSGKGIYVSIGEFSNKCIIANYMLTLPNNIWNYLVDRIYWLNEMFITLGISKCLKLDGNTGTKGE